MVLREGVDSRESGEGVTRTAIGFVMVCGKHAVA